MPKTEMPPFREFAWVQDKFGVSFNSHYQNKSVFKNSVWHTMTEPYGIYL